MRRKWLAAFVLSILLVASVLAYVGYSASQQKKPLSTDSPPIYIRGDGDLDAEHGVVAGSGTPTDPFLIAGWEIDLSRRACAERPCAGIAVENVGASVIIRNVTIRGGPYDIGVSLSSVKGARVESVSITVSGGGIRVVSSVDLTISKNVVAGSSEGVLVAQSRNVYLIANNISHGGQGVIAEDSSRVALLDNILNNNGANGIIASRLVDSTIEGNMITDTGFRTLALFDSLNVVVIRNKIIGSGEECLYVMRGGANSVIQNDISSCAWGGISIMRSSDNTIKDNYLASSRSGITLYESCNNVIARNRAANMSAGAAIPSSPGCNIVVDNDMSANALAGNFHSISADRRGLDFMRTKLSLGKVTEKSLWPVVFEMSLVQLC